MKCPLFIVAVVTKGGTSKGAKADCLEEECAWWDEPCGWCTIKSVDMELVNLLMALRELVNKMPHEEQFRR